MEMTAKTCVVLESNIVNGILEGPALNMLDQLHM